MNSGQGQKKIEDVKGTKSTGQNVGQGQQDQQYKDQPRDEQGKFVSQGQQGVNKDKNLEQQGQYSGQQMGQNKQNK